LLAPTIAGSAGEGNRKILGPEFSRVDCAVLGCQLFSGRGKHFTATRRVRRKNLSIARIKGFTYYVNMNVTLSIEERLVKEARKIAVERDTSLSGLIREHLQKLVEESMASGRRRREREALERSFARFRFRVGERKWRREDLHVRS
jgi:hypothetical protein